MVRRLLWLNGVAAVLAVSHHAASWTITSMFWWAHRYGGAGVGDAGSMQYHALRFVDLFSQTAVTCFLFVSGYFVAATAGQAGRLTWAIPIRRIRSLAPPFALWSIVALAMRTAGGERIEPWNAAWLLVSGGAAAPYYYVPLLATLYLLAPLLVRLARRHWLCVVGPSIVLLLAVALLRTATMLKLGLPFDPPRLLLNSHLAAYSFWFVFGLAAGLQPSRFRDALARVRPVIPLLFLIATLAALAEWELLRRATARLWISSGVTVGDNVFAFALLCAFFSSDADLPFLESIGWLGTMSYGIYMVHVSILELAARGAYHLVPKLMAHHLVFQLLLTLAGTGIAVTMMSGMRRVGALRRVYPLVFG